MLDSKNLGVERATNDLIELVRSFVLDDVGPDPEMGENAQKLKDHYNRLMYLAILNTTKKSFFALKRRLSSRETNSILERPFFDVNVELASPNVTINPSLEDIQAAINRCAINVLRCSKRICQWGQDRKEDIAKLQTFHSLIAKDKEIVKMVLLLTGSIEGTKKQVNEHLETFMKYENLWRGDKQQEYTAFMRHQPSLEAFENELKKYMEIENEVMDLTDKWSIGCICLESSPVKDSLRSEAIAWRSQFANNLHEQAKEETDNFKEHMKDTCNKLDRPINDLDDVRDVMSVLKRIREREAEIDFIICPIEDRYALLHRFDVHVEKHELESMGELRLQWKKVRLAGMSASDKLTQLQGSFKKGLMESVKGFVIDARDFRKEFLQHGPMVSGLMPMEAAERLNKYKRMFNDYKRKWDSYVEGEALFGLPLTRYPEIEESQREIELLDKLYGLYVNVVQTIKGYGNVMWSEIVSSMDSMTEVASGFQNQCKRMPKQLREWDAYHELKTTIDDFFEVLPLLQQLSQKSMRLRHWESVQRACVAEIPMDENGPSPDLCKLQHILDMGMLKVSFICCDSFDPSAPLWPKLSTSRG